MEYILEILTNQGPFDGILGFSQGAGMVTRIVHALLEEERKDPILKKKIQFALLIGGVPPKELVNYIVSLFISFTHRIGAAELM